MALFSTSAQLNINKRGRVVYNEIIELSGYIEMNGAAFNHLTKCKLEELDNSIKLFFDLIEIHKKQIYLIDWNGRGTPLMSVLMSINVFMEQIKEGTGYNFKSKDWFKR